jgi:glycogen debranching enzyme
MVCAPNGYIRADSPDGHGVWVGDTRHLSEFRLLVNDREPVATVVQLEAGSVCLESEVDGLHIERRRYLDEGLHERLTITNHAPSTAAVDVELVVAADYMDMMVLRGFGAATPQERAAPDLVVRPEGTKHRRELATGESFTLTIGHGDFDDGLSRVRDSYGSWAVECASFESDNAAVNELLARSRDDLRMVLHRYPTGIYPTGGVPWYAVPFGRDALWTALFMLPWNPDLARGTLRFLAEHQGVRVDPANEEQPGKILHEVRTGAAVDQGVWPHIFYGDVDAAALFTCLLSETLYWTNDEELFEQLWANAQAALEWCKTYGDADGDAYIECYAGRGRNQGWKDSDDSLTHADGRDAAGYAALCEVQGYFYRALITLARKWPELETRARELKRKFNVDFEIPGDGFIAQALDRSKQRVEAISSNPGHCLWSGILSKEHAGLVAARLVSPELFTGWGIRDLSNRAINYNPRLGSNGCVIPFDCAVAASGLLGAGFVAEAELLSRSLMEAGMAFPHRRIPEFFCGTDRVDNRPPEPHPSSCSPQAWSAAAMFSCLTTLLGLEANARLQRLRIAPIPTRLWSRLEVAGLHFAGHRLDFAVEGDRVKLGSVPRGLTIETA